LRARDTGVGRALFAPSTCLRDFGRNKRSRHLGGHSRVSRNALQKPDCLVAEAVEIEPVSAVEFAENREKYRVNGVLKPKMMLRPSRSAASMGLFSENAFKINREVLGRYQGNVDQNTG
jgi:hypothetical protein